MNRLLISLMVAPAFTVDALAPESIRFPASDGTSLHALLFRARNPRACLVIAHGLQSHAEWYCETGKYLAAQGITVLAFDRRGSGHSGGGHGDTAAATDFQRDLDAAVNRAREEARDVHLLANCFATRFVLPYASEHPESLRSLLITSPATDMKTQADYSFLGRLWIPVAWAIDQIPGTRIWIRTPLKDCFFVSSGPWLEWIHRDSLGVRKVTPRFLLAANKSTRAMYRSVRELQMPLFVLLASHDAMVENQAIRDRFRSYRGPLKVQEFSSEHMLEFGGSADLYRKAVIAWIDGDRLTASTPDIQPEG